jgi:hypothetical protein
MAKHLDRSGQLPELEAKTWMDAFVTKAEELAMDIKTKDAEFWRNANGVPNSAGFD